MKEEFLHHTWKYRLFDQSKLFTVTGEPIEIFKAGDHNMDAGPDFFNAQVKVGGQLWVGNVEVHVRASDWLRHGHSDDRAYDNVILHVVFEQDHEVKRNNGEPVPALELSERIDKGAYARFVQLESSRSWVPCGMQAGALDENFINTWLERLLIARLEKRSVIVKERLARNKNNWEETFYHLLARNFGFSVNNEPFEQLARSLPLNILAKHSDHLFSLEALLFGQAGMLEKEHKDEYPVSLAKEYRYQKQKFALAPMEAHQWKFLRMRPANFPVIRISQFAALISRSTHLLSRILVAEDLNSLRGLFSACVSPYWEDHYVFDKRSASTKKTLGASAIDNIIINTIAPFLFVFGRMKNEERYETRALNYLADTIGEENGIISQWEKIRMPVKTAGQTQALLELKKEYCDKKRCLNCAIGGKLLKG